MKLARCYWSEAGDPVITKETHVLVVCPRCGSLNTPTYGNMGCACCYSLNPGFETQEWKGEPALEPLISGLDVLHAKLAHADRREP